MDNFSVIYKSLKKLEKAMDLDEFSIDDVSAEVLKISESRGYGSKVSGRRNTDKREQPENNA